MVVNLEPNDFASTTFFGLGHRRLAGGARTNAFEYIIRVR